MTSTRHRWLEKVIVSDHPYKSEKTCRRCGVTCASLHIEGERGGVAYLKEYWRGLDRLDDASGMTPDCDGRLEIAENEARSFLVGVLGEAHSDRSMRLATVIQKLCVDASKLGELETLNFDPDDNAGELVVSKGFPRVWWPRLRRAVESGALMHLSIDRTVEIMMVGPK